MTHLTPPAPFRRPRCRTPLPWAAWLGLLAAAAGPAAAQDAANGQALYQAVIVSGRQTCAASACHGGNPASNLNRIRRGASAAVTRSALTNVGDMRFLSGHLTDSQLNDLAAYIAGATGQTASYLSVSTAPVVALGASSLAFGTVTVGETVSRTVSLRNTGNAALNLSGITLASGSQGFSRSSDCGASLAAGTACTLTVQFRPTAAGARSDTLRVASNASGSPHTVGLGGTGTLSAAVGALGWNGTAGGITLPDTAVGATSTPTTLSLRNTGSGTATLTAIVLGGAQAGDFTTGGTCLAGGTVAAGASCTVTVALAPQSAGQKSATLAVTAGNSTLPPSLTLSGTATAAPDGSGGGNGGSPGPNVGAGGCSLLQPGAPDGPADPVLWALALGAAAVLWRRTRLDRGQEPGSRRPSPRTAPPADGAAPLP
ncbi:choice-of-anchor D domain-containing protein [Ideonella livida]|uniref:Choice-of-anchor D domain-containing protein n=1 Tax=Ideonella livida TaxID=2707176 RepID=A0A7C9PKM9_9BURK|nr:choice-of-anchor D domain-containing protein [Ideonella livida]NDY93494.1 choice-of-anchor D domain-containing protein [Ideonella livida]